MFGRRRKFDRAIRERGVPPEHHSSSERDVITTDGPYDVADAPETDELTYLDFGAMRIPATAGFEVRLEMSAGGDLSGVTLVRGASVMQLGVFAAPRSGGAWESISSDIENEIKRTGGKVERGEGEFGEELMAILNNGEQGQPARFLGVDGPRWFLRALIAGPAALEEGELAKFTTVFSKIIVDRGTEPKPVREPITLRLPAQLQRQVEQVAQEAQERIVES